eukprot:CAMPEP_0196723300 /NCGR_PEP_ID=MMETSP1091-20130531/5439_1 /TAXON_ID=302021 /ORGANISM="Rhodomonas sp., Strain CCMP768" /LENGTH=127 /DNA_ID=CAMNT_0042065183 /DNA_START=874 /DNA_END=1257 /DNA_ORIENTATION=-
MQRPQECHETRGGFSLEERVAVEGVDDPRQEDRRQDLRSRPSAALLGDEVLDVCGVAKVVQYRLLHRILVLAADAAKDPNGRPIAHVITVPLHWGIIHPNHLIVSVDFCASVAPLQNPRAAHHCARA